VLLQPAASTRDVSYRTWKSFRETRAVENSVYFIGVNYASEAFGETSVVPPWVDESHEPLVLGTAEGFLLGRIQRSELNSVRTSMPFYRQLCAERES
jgi:predicted amidohydrolase